MIARKTTGRKEFSDMTLVCGDGHQVSAHKVRLVSCSKFFHWHHQGPQGQEGILPPGHPLAYQPSHPSHPVTPRHPSSPPQPLTPLNPKTFPPPPLFAWWSFFKLFPMDILIMAFQIPCLRTCKITLLRPGWDTSTPPENLQIYYFLHFF